MAITLIDPIKSSSRVRQIDSELYRAAKRGSWDDIQNFADQIYWQRTTGGNTVLHVVSQFCDSSDAVQQILAIEPRFIYQRNAKSETALHLAARKGHFNVVKELLSFAKGHESWLISGDMRCCKMLWGTNKAGNTALHEAVRYNFYNVVRLLAEESRPFSSRGKFHENSAPGFGVIAASHRLISRLNYLSGLVGLSVGIFFGFSYDANSAGESPLYLALENQNYGIAAMILSTFNSPSSDGPGKRTALHAAALGKFPECKEVLELILEQLPEVTERVDKYGWTALHYAAKVNNQEVARLLLNKDKSMAYISAHEDGLKAASHIAVIHGHVGVIREILSHCPDCWEMITDEGWNMLHLAVKSEQKEVLEFILQNSWVADLINQKDVNGNTPLHLYVATETLQGHNLVNYPCVNWNATNDAGLTPLDIIIESDEVTDRQNAIKDELEQAGAVATHRMAKTFIIKEKSKISKYDAENGERVSEPHMIIATLMVTVTFAAGFTIPGGYNQNGTNDGMAILAKKAALAVFVISDSFAMLLSMFVVFQLFLIHHRADLWKDLSPLLDSRFLISCAMTSMIIAFVSGLYAVLPVLGIKIYLCVISALLSIPIPFYAIKVYQEIENEVIERFGKVVTERLEKVVIERSGR